MNISSFLRLSVRRELGLGTSGLARCGASLLLILATGEPAPAQPTFHQEIIRGFSSLGVGFRATPALADIDGDGDLDAIVGRWAGDLRYFENTGDAASPSFVERTGNLSPFPSWVSVYAQSAPAFGDLDGDGDLDLAIGKVSGRLTYFKNTGSSSSPRFLPSQSGTADPFGSLPTLNADITPELADLDGDGDLDLVAGDRVGLLAFLENTGSPAFPAFALRTGTTSPVAGFDVGNASRPALADLDADGDLDLAVGDSPGDVEYFRNIGSVAAASFQAAAESDNPFAAYNAATDFRLEASPELADLDGDGDFDAVFGDREGDLTFFANAGSPTTSIFEPVGVTANPFTGIDLGMYSAADLADLDADGDLDAVVGGGSRMRFYANTGTAGAPAFLRRSGTADPFPSAGATGFAPELVDLDHDGDLDIVTGVLSGQLKYFRNTGNPASPGFVAVNGSANPFDLVFTASKSSVALADLDQDGDADAVVGANDLVLRFFWNTGTTATPGFLELTGTANPFGGISGTYRSSPELVDYDGDGDFDLVYKETATRYFRNTGTPFNPDFAERSGSSNPFAALLTTSGGSPDLGDLDGDGDLDILMGGRSGRLYFYRASWAGFSDGFESGDTDRWSITLP